MPVDDLLRNLADDTPGEFKTTFADLMKDRVTQLVADKKTELSTALFGAPATVEPEQPVDGVNNPDTEAEDTVDDGENTEGATTEDD